MLDIKQEMRYEQLFRVTAKFHSSMDMDDVLGEIIHTLQSVYPSYSYYLLLAYDNTDSDTLPIKSFQYDNIESEAAMQAFVTGKVQIEDSVIAKRSTLYAPLKGRQGVYGVLEIIAPISIVFTKNEISFIELLAHTAGSALENAQLYQQSKRLVTDLQLINETSHRLNSNLRLNETMTYISEQLIRSFNADEVGFILLNEESDREVLPGSTELFSDDSNGNYYVNFVFNKIEENNDSIFIGDLSLNKESNLGPFKSLMAVPMMESGLIKGAAIVLHESPYFFSFDMFKLFQSLIHHSTLAITNSLLREELEKLVNTDYLTKLYSRNHLDSEIRKSMDIDAFGTFILIDIDNFKSINDTYGHQVGDTVIVQVANVIKSNIRDNDIGARWGGEELAIYLPKVDLQTGISVAKRLVQKVSENTVPNVTISCGVSFWKKEKENSLLSLVNRADKAMYIAKETGKNQVIVDKSASVL